MSETPEISMDLLELEDVEPLPDLESVFPDFPEEEGGEEEFPREEDDVVWTPFLGPNPMTEIEFQFEDLFLVEVRYLITEPLQQVLGSTIDAYKWTLVRHLDEVFRFRLLKRHFNFSSISRMMKPGIEFPTVRLWKKNSTGTKRGHVFLDIAKVETKPRHYSHKLWTTIGGFV